MDKATCQQMYQNFSNIHKNTLKQMDLVTDADLDFRPTPAVRTLRELLFHMLNMEAEATKAIKTGKWEQETGDQEGAGMGLADLKSLAQQAHKDAVEALEALPESEFAEIVECWWGDKFPKWLCFACVEDEHIHHKGQLTVYLRLLGKEPVMIYDFS